MKTQMAYIDIGQKLNYWLQRKRLWDKLSEWEGKNLKRLKHLEKRWW